MPDKQDFMKMSPAVYLTKEQIEKNFGKVSFAYTQREEDRYYVVAVSRLNEAYLKVYLGIENIDYEGIDYTYKLEVEYSEVV